MNRGSNLLLICSAALLVASPAFAQADKKPQPAPKPDAKAPAGQPSEGAPDQKMMEDMQAMMKAATPGKMHERLMRSCGTWEGKMTCWMKPGGPALESTSTSTMTSMMGGRFVHLETHCMMNMGMGAPMPFEGFGLYGYDNTTEKFQSVWADNMGTMMMNFTGELSADGKTITWTSKFIDPVSKKESWMREVDREDGPDAMTLEMWMPGQDGKDFKMMEIKYTRKAGEAGKKMDGMKQGMAPKASQGAQPGAKPTPAPAPSAPK